MGLRLDSVDDELELIAILQEFSRLERKKQVEVYFDGAPTHRAGAHKHGTITAHFVPLNTTADNAIRSRLKKMGNSAKTWTVVTSDRRVQLEARDARAEVITSDAFAKLLKQARNTASKSSNDKKLSEQEIEDWLKLFTEKNHK